MLTRAAALPTVPPARTGAATVPVLHPLVRWAFCVFVVSLPFEYPRRTIPWEVTTITCAVFLLAAALQPRASFGRLPWAVRWFAVYLYAYLAAFVLTGGEYGDEVRRLFILLVQAVLLLWAAFNVLRDQSLARTALLAFVLACSLRAAVQLLGIGTSSHAEWTGGERISALGQNANHSAMILTAGLLTLLGLAYGRAPGAWRSRLPVWALLAAMAIAVVQNGSRGGIIALAVGLVAFATGGRSVGLKLRNAAIVLVALGFLLGASYQSEGMRSRFEQTVSTGFMAGRERIFPTAWQMFLQRPVTGWGPIHNKYELAGRIPEHRKARRDTHNLVLEVATATGLVGLVPFFLGTLLALRRAWRARRGAQGALPFALLVAVLTANLSGNWIAAPILWFALAYALASAEPPPPEAA